MKAVFQAAHALNRFMRLPEPERLLIVEAGFYLICAKVATFTTSTRTLLALGKLDANQGMSQVHVASAPAEIAATVEAAVIALDKSSHRLVFANCLIRALALRMMLARRDLTTELHIGARKDEQGQFAAHAWLTYKDTILVGGEDAKNLYRELVGSSHALLQ